MKDLYNHYRSTCNYDLEGPEIIDEVIHAIKIIKDGKASGPDNTSIQLIKWSGKTGINRLTSILNSI